MSFIPGEGRLTRSREEREVESVWVNNFLPQDRELLNLLFANFFAAFAASREMLSFSG
jgi:hypothetical protein